MSDDRLSAPELRADDRLERLQDALLDAFPSESDVRELLFRMGLRDYVFPTDTRSLSAMMFSVISYTRSRGLIDRLLLPRACELRPYHKGLHDTVGKYWPAVLAPVSPDPPPPRTELRDATLCDDDWHLLIAAIRDGHCTPVIGAAACHPVLPNSMEIAAEWADRWKYPFPDRADLARVSQFLALTKEDSLMPHQLIHERYAMTHAPDFKDRDDPHGLLADLPLPLYLTTSHVDFMSSALASRHRKATRGLLGWNQTIREQAPLDRDPPATIEDPLVYHLFGYHDILESMVMTEDEHLDFLTSVVEDKKLFPSCVQRALGTTSLLFLGYGVRDWSFRVLVRALLKSRPKNRRIGVAVLQLPPETLSDVQLAQVEKYLEKFLNEIGHIQFRVFWGDAREFTHVLRDKWEEEQRRHATAS